METEGDGSFAAVKTEWHADAVKMEWAGEVRGPASRWGTTRAVGNLFCGTGRGLCQCRFRVAKEAYGGPKSPKVALAKPDLLPAEAVLLRRPRPAAQLLPISPVGSTVLRSRYITCVGRESESGAGGLTREVETPSPSKNHAKVTMTPVMLYYPGNAITIDPPQILEHQKQTLLTGGVSQQVNTHVRRFVRSIPLWF
jgi:hypothetical protein